DHAQRSEGIGDVEVAAVEGAPPEGEAGEAAARGDGGDGSVGFQPDHRAGIDVVVDADVEPAPAIVGEAVGPAAPGANGGARLLGAIDEADAIERTTVIEPDDQIAVAGIQ